MHVALAERLARSQHDAIALPYEHHKEPVNNSGTASINFIAPRARSRAHDRLLRANRADVFRRT